MRTKTYYKMPKEIVTLEQYDEWFKQMNETHQGNFEVEMKQRTSFYPYAFTTIRKVVIDYVWVDTVHYLISDTVSTGIAKVTSFNKIFNFISYQYD
jgi:hypothetical protein